MPVNDSVRASKEGLETIIIPEMKKKGWIKGACIWALDFTVYPSSNHRIIKFK